MNHLKLILMQCTVSRVRSSNISKILTRQQRLDAATRCRMQPRHPTAGGVAFSAPKTWEYHYGHGHGHKSGSRIQEHVTSIASQSQSSCTTKYIIELNIIGGSIIDIDT